MEAILTDIVGVLKFFWDLGATVVYTISEGLFPIFSMIFKPLWFVFDYAVAATPDFNALGSATSTISAISTDAHDFMTSILPEFIFPTIYAVFVVALFIGAIHSFKKS